MANAPDSPRRTPDPGPDPSDITLSRYLLGDLPEQQAESLDERSIVDPAFAERLRGIEHDLADAYVRGELSAHERQRWERTCGASTAGQDQLRLAEALAMAERRRAPVARVALVASSPHRIRRRMLGLAAAVALAATLAAAYAVRDDEAASGALSWVATIGTRSPAATEASSQRAGPPTVTLTLAAPTGDPGDAPVLSIPAGTSHARLTLRLQRSGLPQYAVGLRDLASGRVVWRMTDLISTDSTAGRVLEVTVPATAFRTGRFALDVHGAAARGSELIGTYPLIVDVNRP
jgi:hypothetical protein